MDCYAARGGGKQGLLHDEEGAKIDTSSHAAPSHRLLRRARPARRLAERLLQCMAAQAQLISERGRSFRRCPGALRRPRGATGSDNLRPFLRRGIDGAPTLGRAWVSVGPVDPPSSPVRLHQHRSLRCSSSQRLAAISVLSPLILSLLSFAPTTVGALRNVRTPSQPVPRTSTPAMPSEAISAMAHTTEKVGAEIQVVENVRREIDDYDNVVAEARQATEDQHAMTLREGLRRYPKAVAWSMLLSTAIIMEGFDVVLLGSFYALPQFNKKYGEQLPDGSYTVSAPWQAGLCECFSFACSV